jgi:copper chaperone CopZ
MKRILLLASLVLAAPAAALACGDKPCSEAGCKMPAAGAPTSQLPADGTRAAMTIEGMKCGACAAKIKTAIDAIPGVKGSVVDAAGGSAEVAFDATKTNAAAIVAAVNSLGHYKATAK